MKAQFNRLTCVGACRGVHQIFASPVFVSEGVHGKRVHRTCLLTADYNDS